MKSIFLTLVCLSIYLPLQAQDFAVGPKLGVAHSTIHVTGENFESGDFYIGYHLGAFVRMGGHSIFIQPEILYTNSGGTVIRTGDDQTDIKFDANFNRVDLPMMMGFKVLRVLRFQGGPIATFLLDYTIEDAFQIASELDYRSALIGYQAGLGLDIGNFILDFKYESSLSRIARSTTNFQADQRQNQFILSAGFRLF